MTVNKKTWPELRYKIAAGPEAGDPSRRLCSAATVACLCSASALLVASLVGTYLLWFTGFYEDFVHSATMYADGSEFFRGWLAPPFGPTTKLYLYNYTNAAAFMAGNASRLRVEELGPYAYSETLEHVNVHFHPNGTMSYQEKRAFTFHPEWSRGSEDDVIVVPNLPLIVMRHRPRPRRALRGPAGAAQRALGQRRHVLPQAQRARLPVRLRGPVLQHGQEGRGGGDVGHAAQAGHAGAARRPEHQRVHGADRPGRLPAAGPADAPQRARRPGRLAGARVQQHPGLGRHLLPRGRGAPPRPAAPRQRRHLPPHPARVQEGGDGDGGHPRAALRAARQLPGQRPGQPQQHVLLHALVRQPAVRRAAQRALLHGLAVLHLLPALLPRGPAAPGGRGRHGGARQGAARDVLRRAPGARHQHGRGDQAAGERDGAKGLHGHLVPGALRGRDHPAHPVVRDGADGVPGGRAAGHVPRHVHGAHGGARRVLRPAAGRPRLRRLPGAARRPPPPGAAAAAAAPERAGRPGLVVPTARTLSSDKTTYSAAAFGRTAGRCACATAHSEPDTAQRAAPGVLRASDQPGPAQPSPQRYQGLTHHGDNQGDHRVPAAAAAGGAARAGARAARRRQERPGAPVKLGVAQLVVQRQRHQRGRQVPEGRRLPALHPGEPGRAGAGGHLRRGGPGPAAPGHGAAHQGGDARLERGRAGRGRAAASVPRHRGRQLHRRQVVRLRHHLLPGVGAPRAPGGRARRPAARLPARQARRGRRVAAPHRPQPGRAHLRHGGQDAALRHRGQDHRPGPGRPAHPRQRVPAPGQVRRALRRRHPHVRQRAGLPGRHRPRRLLPQRRHLHPARLPAHRPHAGHLQPQPRLQVPGGVHLQPDGVQGLPLRRRQPRAQQGGPGPEHRHGPGRACQRDWLVLPHDQEQLSLRHPGGRAASAPPPQQRQQQRQ